MHHSKRTVEGSNEPMQRQACRTNEEEENIRGDVTAGWGGHSELAPGDSIPDRLKIHART